MTEEKLKAKAMTEKIIVFHLCVKVRERYFE